MDKNFSISECLNEFINLIQNGKVLNSLTLRFGKVRKNSFDFSTSYDKPDNYFTVYAHKDGYRIRKTILNSGYFGSRHQYQMFRNSHTGEWPAFKTPKEAFERFEKRIAKKVA